MNLRSQSISPQLIVSLFAAVAVNSAIWWHRSQRQLEEKDDSDDVENQSKKKQQVAEKERASQRNTSNVDVRSRNAVLRKPQHPGGSKASSSPMKSTTYPKQSVQGVRPVVKMNRSTPVKAKMNMSPRKTPRVRESLLPWNGRKQNDLKVKATRKPLTRQINLYDPDFPSMDSVNSNFTSESTASRSRKVIQPKVRNSLLPWNKKASSPKAPVTEVASTSPKKTATMTARSPRRAPRVRESLLPWSPKQSAASTEIDTEPWESTKAQDRIPMDRIPMVRHSLLPWHSNDSNSVAKSTPSDDTTSVALGANDVAEVCLSPSNMNATDAGSQFFPAGIKDSNVTSRSRGPRSSSVIDGEFQSPPSYLKSGSIATRSPLIDSTNKNKSSTRKSKKASRELKEPKWKNSSVKSPTLLRLSRRADDHDVHSIRRVFDP
jgi:hypothetical protein